MKLETTTADQVKLEHSEVRMGLRDCVKTGWELMGILDYPKRTSRVFQFVLCGHFRADRQFKNDLYGRIRAY